MSFDAWSRRRFLKSVGLTAAGAAFPELLIPKTAYAQTPAFGAVHHVIYIRLASAFRFTAVFNGNVNSNHNPYGRSSNAAPGTQWGVSSLLDSASWLTNTTKGLGMVPVPSFSNEICVLACVDHEPTAAGADGNHGTGLQRFLTGYLGGSTGFLTYVNYAVRQQVANALVAGQILLPAFSLGEPGMATASDTFAQYRPPVLAGTGFDGFAADPQGALPAWAQTLYRNMDARTETNVTPMLATPVDTYRLTRTQARAYSQIFTNPILKVDNQDKTLVDGISNLQLEQMFGTSDVGRRAALMLRLFHFGCPLGFMNQGAYDLHSQENSQLPQEIDELCRLLSGFRAALKVMPHPTGGTYWDKTLVVLGSEFGRTTADSPFNSANGSDHDSDFATRWMSMPMMGGVVSAYGKGGAILGGTDPATLAATGAVYSYRSVLLTMLDLLGGEYSIVFPNDTPIQALFA